MRYHDQPNQYKSATDSSTQPQWEPPAAAHRPPTMLSVGMALDQLNALPTVRLDTETVPLLQAHGRVLAHDLVAMGDLPRDHCSAVDGYACAAEDTRRGVPLVISQKIYAGTVPVPLQSGTAAVIATGAVVPPGANTVVPKERGRELADCVALPAETAPGLNIRPQGEEIARSATALTQGTVFHPPHLAMAAALGLDSVPVHRRLRIAYLATGNELVVPGAAYRAGSRFDTNTIMTTALLTSLGCQVVTTDPLRDDVAMLAAALTRAAARADLILTSGGISVGPADCVALALARAGTVLFSKVAIKPGRPITAGTIDGRPILCLPGNPVANYVTFCLFAAPLIRRLQGRTTAHPTPIFARADFEIPSADTATRYWRAHCVADATVQYNRIKLIPNQSSASLLPLTHATGLVQIDPYHTVTRDQPLRFWPFAEMLS